MTIPNLKEPITPYVELENCAGCKRLFRNGDECWAINYKKRPVVYSCSACWSKYTTEKFTFAR